MSCIPIIRKEEAPKAPINAYDSAEARQPLLAQTALPDLTVPLRLFVPPHAKSSGPIYRDLKSRLSYFATDVEVLEEVCELLESLAMDDEDVRLALVRKWAQNEEPPSLDYMLDFIDSAEYLPDWLESEVPPDELKRWMRTVDICKTAVIRAVVELATEERNLEPLWDISNANGFVQRMLKWLKDAHDEGVRDDLIICSTLSLGNLIRNGKPVVKWRGWKILTGADAGHPCR